MVQQKKRTDVGNRTCRDQPVNKHIPYLDILPFDTYIWRFQILLFKYGTVKFLLCNRVALDSCQKVRLIFVKKLEKILNLASQNI